MSWANPTPEWPFDFDPEQLVRDGALPDMDISYETGLFWDMLTDLAWLLRGDSDLNPIRDYPRQAICLTGWSQSGAYLFRYLNSFAIARMCAVTAACLTDTCLAVASIRCAFPSTSMNAAGNTHTIYCVWSTSRSRLSPSDRKRERSL